MKGAFPIFRLAGIRVYLHFTWFIVAALEVVRFAGRDRNPIWAAFEYLALFAIVLAHEFGHTFACRQTGGQADTVLLWPLGGIAFVKPPPRPGALEYRRGPARECDVISNLHVLCLYHSWSPLENRSSGLL